MNGYAPRDINLTPQWESPLHRLNAILGAIKASDQNEVRYCHPIAFPGEGYVTELTKPCLKDQPLVHSEVSRRE
jgi:hypothetical protein